MYVEHANIQLVRGFQKPQNHPKTAVHIHVAYIDYYELVHMHLALILSMVFSKGLVLLAQY